MTTQKSKSPVFVSVLGAVTAFIAALTPLYISYFNNTAEKKADLAYELLVQRVEHHEALLQEVTASLQDLRHAVRLYTLTGAIAAELKKDVKRGEDDVEALADKAHMLEMSHTLDKEEAQQKTLEVRPLPRSLDAELQQRQK